MMKLINRRQRGFTLIELLVVIAIIGILASIVLVSLNSARSKSRDARRVSDIRQAMTALELYYNDKNGYPVLAATVVEARGLGDTGWVNPPVAPVYLGNLSAAPTPVDCSGGAAADNQYTYTGTATTYTITTCLGAATAGFADGADADTKITLIGSQTGLIAQ